MPVQSTLYVANEIKHYHIVCNMSGLLEKLATLFTVNATSGHGVQRAT